jgi:sterol desaturase/sphingolipid hydroxylase (fatty acid hydroxylase superfamily)
MTPLQDRARRLGRRAMGAETAEGFSGQGPWYHRPMAKDYPGKLSPEARAAFRAQQLLAIPSWYRPWAHLAFPSVFGLGIIAACAAVCKDVRPLEWAVVPLMILLSNAAEWRVHRDVLHKRQRLLEILYDRHTPIHHRLYVTEDMAMRDRREFRLVLLPAYAIVIILLATIPLAAALWLAGQRNAAALFLATCIGYTLAYEWLHLLYHLPADSFLGRRWLVRVLRRQHATHHDPALMQRYNFNVTIPLWDLVRGTLHKGLEQTSTPVPSMPSRLSS